MSGKYEINMTEGPLLGKIFLFALPLMLSGMLQLLFNAADVIVVGKFVGSTALAAVGSTGSLINLIIGMFMGLSVGTNVICAKGYGAQNGKMVSDCVHTSVMLSLVLGGFLAAFGFIMAPIFLSWMGTPSDVIDQASLYLRIYFLGMPVIMLYNYASAVLRAVGDTRRPLYYLTIAGVLNVVLNLFLVIVVKIGVAGVAIATVVSQAVSAGLVVRCLLKADGLIHLNPRALRIHWKTLGEMMRIGLPAGLQGITFSLSNVLIQSSINTFGSNAIAGNTAASNLESFNGTAVNAIYQTNLSFTSQNVGAKTYSRIPRIIFLCLGMAVIISSFMGIGTFLGGNIFLRLYTDSDEVVKYGMIRLSFVAKFEMLGSLMDTPVGALRGMDISLTPMIVSLTGVCVFRIVWLSTAFASSPTLQTLYASYPISWTITAIVHHICLFIFYRRLTHKKT